MARLTDIMQSCTGSMYVSDPRLEKKRKGYAFWRQFYEKLSMISGCPGDPRVSYVFNDICTN